VTGIELSTSADTPACPTWCISDEAGWHSHVSDQERVHTLAAHLVQLAGREPVAMVLGQLATIQQATAFAYGVLRLAAAATLAPPGLGFLETLAARMSVTIPEMAQASGLDETRLRKQATGRRVLTAGEFDALALAVVRVITSRAS
jgi:hypothetical protein